MSEPRSIEELNEAVEALVAGYMAHVRASVLTSVERGCAPATSGKDLSGSARGGSSSPQRPAGPRKMSPKRSPEMLAQMTDDLYERIVASPGGAMSKFAEELRREVTELQVPITMLKKQKRVRTIGDRQSMRYFPVPA
jgi:hypothetical protein